MTLECGKSIGDLTEYLSTQLSSLGKKIFSLLLCLQKPVAKFRGCTREKKNEKKNHPLSCVTKKNWEMVVDLHKPGNS